MSSTDPKVPADEHRRAWDAIPWVLNGRARAEDVDAVDRHLPHCADCRDEWRFQALLRHRVADDDAPVPDAGPAYARLCQRLDDEDAIGRGAARAAATATAPRDDVGSTPAIAASPAPTGAPGPATAAPRRRRRGDAALLGRWLHAAVGLQAVGIVVLASMLWTRVRPPSATDATLGAPPSGTYATLGAPPGIPAAPVLRLVPAPGLTLGALAAMLDDSGAAIATSNPHGSILTLSVAPGTSAIDVLQKLRGRPGVLLVEPIGRADGRGPGGLGTDRAVGHGVALPSTGSVRSGAGSEAPGSAAPGPAERR